jgi:hypothetical protein
MGKGRPAAAPATEAKEQPQAAKAGARAGKVQLGAYVDQDAKRQLDVFAAMNGRTIQSLVEEMMDDFFRKNGLHRLASHRSAA